MTRSQAERHAVLPGLHLEIGGRGAAIIGNMRERNFIIRVGKIGSGFIPGIVFDFHAEAL